MNEIRLGSLFDGIGVFPLAAVRCGIVPAWASEIEKAPISITKRHFPGMAHLGDVTKLNGGDIPPVHIITFGSPCQNLSQIGNRAGLAGEKSSLFFHAIRIIREMREATTPCRFKMATISSELIFILADRAAMISASASGGRRGLPGIFRASPMPSTSYRAVRPRRVCGCFSAFFGSSGRMPFSSSGAMPLM